MKRVSLLLTVFAAFTFFMISCGGATTPKSADKAAAPEVAPTEKVAEPAAKEVAEPAAKEVAEPAAKADVAANLENGKVVYGKACFACHTAGVAGAAKLDDKARWDASAAKGIATLDDHAINGFTGEHGVMPAKGGNTTLTDQGVKDAVAYMLSKAGVTAE